MAKTVNRVGTIYNRVETEREIPKLKLHYEHPVEKRELQLHVMLLARISIW